MQSQIDYSNDLRLHHVIVRNFEENDDSDFTISCANGQKFHVHRVILKKCLFFHTFFARQLEEIPETNHDAFEHEPCFIHLILNYLYGRSPIEVLTGLLMKIVAVHDQASDNHATLIDELAFNTEHPAPYGWEGYASRINARSHRSLTSSEAEVAAHVLHRLLLLYLAVAQYQLSHLQEYLREQIYLVLPDAWGHHEVLHSLELIYQATQEQSPSLQNNSHTNSHRSHVSPLAEHCYALLKSMAERLDMLGNEPLFTATLDRHPSLARDLLLASQLVVTAPRWSEEVMFCGNRKCRQNRLIKWMRKLGSKEDFDVKCVVCHENGALEGRKTRMWEYLEDVLQISAGAGERERLLEEEEIGRAAARQLSREDEEADKMEILSEEDLEEEEDEEAVMTDESEDEEEEENGCAGSDGVDDGEYDAGNDSDESVEL